MQTETFPKPAPPPAEEKKQLTRAEALVILNQRTRQVRQELAGAFDQDDYQKTIMLRYPRLVAHLICESLGYFCPRSAANAINAYKDSRPFWCEWYAHMADCTLRNWDERVRYGYEKGPKPTKADGLMVKIGRETLQHAFQNRRHHQGYMAEYLQGRLVILQELAGHGPELASWF